MALAFYFSPKVMSAEQYDQCIARLKKAGADHPPGRLYHAAFGPAEHVAVFDVWSSQAAFDAFGVTLMPILQGARCRSRAASRHAGSQGHRSAGSAAEAGCQEARDGQTRGTEEEQGPPEGQEALAARPTRTAGRLPTARRLPARSDCSIAGTP